MLQAILSHIVHAPSEQLASAFICLDPFLDPFPENISVRDVVVWLHISKSVVGAHIALVADFVTDIDLLLIDC